MKMLTLKCYRLPRMAIFIFQEYLVRTNMAVYGFFFFFFPQGKYLLLTSLSERHAKNHVIM